MNKLLIFLILLVPTISLLIIFPNLNRNTENRGIEAIYNDIGYAKNLCMELCLRYSTYNLTGACISDSDTITGKYWVYPNISCYVGPVENPCINKGILEIRLYENCSIEKITLR